MIVTEGGVQGERMSQQNVFNTRDACLFAVSYRQSLWFSSNRDHDCSLILTAWLLL